MVKEPWKPDDWNLDACNRLKGGPAIEIKDSFQNISEWIHCLPTVCPGTGRQVLCSTLYMSSRLAKGELEFS